MLFIKTNMIQVCSTFHWARVPITNTCPEALADSGADHRRIQVVAQNPEPLNSRPQMLNAQAQHPETDTLSPEPETANPKPAIALTFH